MPLAPSRRTLDADASPSFGAGRKLRDVEQALLWALLQEEPGCPSRALHAKATPRWIMIAVSLRHVNRWRAARGLNRRPGRPGDAEGYRPVACGAEVVRGTPRLSCVGAHVFAHWLAQHDALGPVVARLTQAAASHQQTHPEDDFALLPHRESTVLHRFEALLLAPLWGYRASQRGR